jgi:hypothetical protein
MTRELIKTIKDIPDTSSYTEVLEKKGLIKVVQNFVPTPHTFAGTTVRPGTIITPMLTSITTTFANTKIMYELSLSYELHHDNVFVLERVVNSDATEIASGNPAGSSAYGFAVSFYDNDYDSTPQRINFSYLDEPNVPADTVVSYRLRYYGSSTHTMALNRTINATTTVAYERSSSVVLLTELGV